MRADTAGRIRRIRDPDSSTAIDMYLRDIERYPLLAVLEEDRIARRARSGDPAALDILIRSNLRFVISVAKRYQNRGLLLADLIQEGNVGLVTAARKFDPDQGVKFISYAVWWIRQAILSAFAKQGRSVRLPLNRATELARVVRVANDLRQEYGRDPTIHEIAEVSELEPLIVELLLSLNLPDLRLDAPVRGEEDSQLLDRFLVDGADLVGDFEAILMRERVSEALLCLRPRDATVIRLYYGLQGETAHTLEQIGAELGVTRERVRQLRDRALGELQHGASRWILSSFNAA